MVDMRMIGSLFGKAKQLARQNPDKVRSGLDKVEQLVDGKTGGKYHDQIAKGSDALSRGLGVPTDARTQNSPAAPTQQTAPQSEAASTIDAPSPIDPPEPIDPPRYSAPYGNN